VDKGKSEAFVYHLPSVTLRGGFLHDYVVAIDGVTAQVAAFRMLVVEIERDEG